MNDFTLKKDLIYKQLKKGILNGKYPPGSKLPKELDFAKQLGVGKVTLRAALEKLQKERLILRVHGKGSFVAGNVNDSKGCFMAMVKDADDISVACQYILPGIAKRLKEFGLRLETCSLPFICTHTLEEGVALLKRHKIQGVFFLKSTFTGNDLADKILHESGLPVVAPHVVTFRDAAAVNFALMKPDWRLAFGDGIRHLAKLGHKRIGTIYWDICHDIRGFTPEEYLEFLSLNNLDPSSNLVKKVGYSCEHITRAVREMILGPNPPTAIACFSDFFAIHVCEALKLMNVSVPEQVAVMGFCGYLGGKFMDPSLSTVDLMYENIGEMAVDLMLKSKEWGRNDAKPPVVITPHRLIERESSHKVLTDM